MGCLWSVQRYMRTRRVLWYFSRWNKNLCFKWKNSAIRKGAHLTQLCFLHRCAFLTTLLFSEKCADYGIGDERLSSDDMLLLATDNLRKGIEYAVRQVRSKKVDPSTKLRWMRALTRQVEALVKVVEAQSNIGSKSAKGLDLATFLSSVQKRIEVPVREARTMHREASELNDVVRQASLSEGSVGSVGRRRTCRNWG